MNECSVRVYSGARHDFRGHMCQRKATVEREGVAYCALHDPQKVAQKKANETARAQAIKRQEDALHAEADSLSDALGVSRTGALYNYGTRTPMARISITFDEAKRLIARLS